MEIEVLSATIQALVGIEPYFYFLWHSAGRERSLSISFLTSEAAAFLVFGLREQTVANLFVPVDCSRWLASSVSNLGNWKQKGNPGNSSLCHPAGFKVPTGLSTDLACQVFTLVFNITSHISLMGGLNSQPAAWGHGSCPGPWAPVCWAKPQLGFQGALC